MAKRKGVAGDRIGQLEDELKARDRRIAELRDDLDKLNDTVRRCREALEDDDAVFEQWKEAFDMKLNDHDRWEWRLSFVEGEEWYEKYRAIRDEWNRFVPDYNAAIGHGNKVGRPLEASEAQCEEVLERRKAGESLRGIAEEMTLGLRTVRTIVDSENGSDRTTIKHLARIDPDRAAERSWKRRKQMRDALPKRIHEAAKTRAALIKEAKGLGKN